MANGEVESALEEEVKASCAALFCRLNGGQDCPRKYGGVVVIVVEAGLAMHVAP